MKPARFGLFAAVVVLLGAGAGPGSVAAQPAPSLLNPVYAVTVVDPTSAGAVPPANPAAGETPVDSYTADLYERPFRVGPGGTTVLPALDIVSSRAGVGATHLHYRINLAGPAPGPGKLSYSYGFEIDYDDDPAGDLLVRVDDPGAGVGPTFGTRGVSAFWNENSNVTGPNQGVPDGPDATPDGYEVVVFDQGTNRRPKAVGGDAAVLARLAPDRAASVEIAVDAAFLQNLNADLAVTKVSFRAGASERPLDHRTYYLHDKLGRAGAGSPYPFLQLPGAPAVCPARDDALSAEQRSALDSGTGSATGMANPCHPSAGVSAYDNAVFATAAPGAQPVFGQAGPDLSVSASHRGKPGAGDRASFTLAVRNAGNGRTTGPVTLDTVIPPGLGLVSATGRGWRCTASGQDVRCRRPAALAPGAAATPVILRAEVGPGARAGATLVVRVSSAGDSNAANDTTTDRLDAASSGGRSRRSPVLLIGLTIVFVGSLVLLRRLSRAERRPATSGP